MRKLKLFLLGAVCCAIAFPMNSCSSEFTDEVLNEENPVGVEPRIDLNVVMHIVQYATRKGITEMVTEPSTEKERELHRFVYSAAAGRWLADGDFGEKDVYSGVYFSWSRLVESQSSSRSMNDEEFEMTAELEEALTMALAELASADWSSDPIVRQGEYYDAIMEEIGKLEQSTLYGASASVRRAYVFDLVQELLPNTIPFDDIDMALSIRINEPIINTTLETSRFTVTEGFNSLKNGYTDQKLLDAIDLMSMCTEVIMANPDIAIEFATGLIPHCNNSVVTRSLGEEETRKFLTAVMTAAYAVNFIPAEPEVPVEPPYLTLSHSTATVSAFFQDFTFTINSNTDWTISVSPAAMFKSLTASEKNGTGTETKTINTLINQTGSSRTGYITVSYTGERGPDSRTIVITQPYPTINYALSNTAVINTDGRGEYSGGMILPTHLLNIYSNTTWTIQGQNTNGTTTRNWVGFDQARSYSGNQAFYYRADPNYTGASRSGRLCIKTGNTTSYITVNQTSAGTPSYSIPETLTCNGYGGDKTFAVTSNLFWRVKYHRTPDIFYTLPEQSGWGDGNIKVQFETYFTVPSGVSPPRTGTITVEFSPYRNFDGPILYKRTINVRQTPIIA